MHDLQHEVAQSGEISVETPDALFVHRDLAGGRGLAEGHQAAAVVIAERLGQRRMRLAGQALEQVSGLLMSDLGCAWQGPFGSRIYNGGAITHGIDVFMTYATQVIVAQDAAGAIYGQIEIGS